MRFSGACTELDVDLDEHDYEVVEAVVTSKRIAIDWIEDADKFHVVAISRDGGLSYQGNFGCPVPDNGWNMEITRFTAKNKAELLLAKWVQRDSGRGGWSIFQLWPGK
jgi:hypothetical protein